MSGWSWAAGADALAELRGAALELALLAADAALCSLLAAAVRSSGRAISQLRDAPSLDADTGLVQLVTDAGGTLKYVAVRGTVQPLAEPIRARGDDTVQGVLHRLSLQEYTMEASGTTGFWSERRRTIRQTINTVPFAICGRGLQVEVQDATSLDTVDLYTVRDEYVSADSSLAQSVWQWLLGERKQGMRDVEEMLRVGTQVTGYGELARTERGVALRPPAELPYILTTRSEGALLRELSTERRVVRLLLVTLAAAGAAGALWTGRRLWLGVQQRHRRRALAAQYDAIRTERRRRERAGAAVPDAVQCVVCLTNPREVVVSPCQHVCLCVDCEERLPKRSCPVCRRTVTAVLPVYLA